MKKHLQKKKNNFIAIKIENTLQYFKIYCLFSIKFLKQKQIKIKTARNGLFFPFLTHDIYEFS